MCPCDNIGLVALILLGWELHASYITVLCVQAVMILSPLLFMPSLYSHSNLKNFYVQLQLHHSLRCLPLQHYRACVIDSNLSVNTSFVKLRYQQLDLFNSDAITSAHKVHVHAVFQLHVHVHHSLSCVTLRQYRDCAVDSLGLRITCVLHHCTIRTRHPNLFLCHPYIPPSNLNLYLYLVILSRRKTSFYAILLLFHGDGHYNTRSKSFIEEIILTCSYTVQEEDTQHFTQVHFSHYFTWL